MTFSSIATNERGFALALAGRRDDALALHREVLRLSTSSGDVRFVATALEGVAGCLPDTDAARVGDVAGRSRGRSRRTRARDRRRPRAMSTAVAARARAALGDRQFEEALEAGRGLSVDDAIGLALRDEPAS